jgi:hypothetical protein
MSFFATTGGITGNDVRDLMLAAVEHRFGLVNRLMERAKASAMRLLCGLSIGVVFGSTRSPEQSFGSPERHSSHCRTAIQ